MHNHYIDKAVKENLISLGIISIFSVLPFSLLIVFPYADRWFPLMALSFCGMSLLGYLSSLLLAHYYNRFYESLKLYDKRFFIFLGRYLARAVFAIALFMLIAKCGITILQFIRNILIDYGFYNYQEATNIVFLPAFLIYAVLFIYFLNTLSIFHIIIFSPLMGDDDKTYKTAWRLARYLAKYESNRTQVFFILWENKYLMPLAVSVMAMMCIAIAMMIFFKVNLLWIIPIGIYYLIICVSFIKALKISDCYLRAIDKKI